MKIRINPVLFLNQSIYFLMGFFIDMFYFFFCIKILNSGGVLLVILSTFAYNYYFFKKPKTSKVIQWINKGAFTFNIILSVLIIILVITSYGLISHLLS